MRTSLAKYWGYTTLAAIVIIGTTNINVSFAGIVNPDLNEEQLETIKANKSSNFFILGVYIDCWNKSSN